MNKALANEFARLAADVPDWTLVGSACAMWLRREPPPHFNSERQLIDWVVGQWPNGGEQLLDHDHRLIAFLVFAFTHRDQIATAIYPAGERSGE